MSADSSSAPVIDVRGLHAGYGGIAVVHDLSMHVGSGEVVVLLGPNGAGKTTTLRRISSPAEGWRTYPRAGRCSSISLSTSTFG